MRYESILNSVASAAKNSLGQIERAVERFDEIAFQRHPMRALLVVMPLFLSIPGYAMYKHQTRMNDYEMISEPQRKFVSMKDGSDPRSEDNFKDAIILMHNQVRACGDFKLLVADRQRLVFAVENPDPNC